MNIFDTAEKPNSVFPAECPVCKEQCAHICMHRYDDKHGGVWLWCSNCKSFMHMSGIIPDWWKNCEAVDRGQLEASPEYLDSMVDIIDPWVTQLRNVDVVNEHEKC